MAKVWWKFKQNRAKATRVIEQNLKIDQGMTEWQNHGQTEKQYTPHP